MRKVFTSPSLIVFLGACSFGILSTIVKLAQHEGFAPSEITGSQFVIGALLSWIAAAYKRRMDVKKGKLPAAVSLSQALSLMAVGTFTGLTGLLYYYSLKWLSASMAIMLLFQFTWLGIVLEAIVTRRLPSKGKVMAVTLLFAGTLLSTGVLGQGDLSADWPPIGLAFGLASAVAFTLFVFFSGKISVKIDPFIRSAWMVTGAAILISVIHPPLFIWNGSLEAGLWKWGLMLAVFGGLLPPLLFAIGIPKLSSGIASILCAAELPTVLLAAYLVLKESLAPLQWGGVIIILIGIAWPEIMRRLETRKGRIYDG